MLPIALTCPVWWVARWAARMLASLAVVVAFSLGTATVPVGVSAAAPASTGLTLRTAAGAPAVPRAEHVDTAAWQRVTAAERHGVTAAERQHDLGAARQNAPVGVPEPPPEGAVAPPAGRLPLPGGQPPASAGPRAPPAR
ncbi:hypothetical protein [Micromonospora sp. NPDC049282]|uniref:hypothetical protein n=1 Tax=Micromonospora sp. NPDC049282 TaxID=3364269 RepID=UPI00371C5FE9